VGERTPGKHWSEIVDIVVRELRGTIDIEAVILHGSWARGGGGDWSDVDLLVVTDSVKSMSVLNRLYISAEYRRYGVDLLLYTFEELERMASKGNPLALSALIEGTPIVSSRRVEELRSRVAGIYTRRGRMWIRTG
jgi:predicted nucleotidyltransferase